MTVPEYIEHRGLTVIDSNPRRKCFMPNNNPTKADLEDIVDQVQSILEGAYQPESTREDLAATVGDALDALARPEEEDEDEDVDEDDENGD